jgi:serine/threonine-protein kinase
VPPELKPGARIGPYRLGERLGEGAVGIVVEAVRDPDGAPVALKVLRPELAPSEVFVRRFEHEVRVARQLRHPNLVPVLDADVADGVRYLAAPLVAGRSLARRLQLEGPLAVGDTLAVASDIGAGLTALHRRGLIHRDVKPSNVLLEDGRALLSDFGLAKGAALTVLTKPGQLVGTPQYLAPELLEGGEASPASDIYAFGCVVFECLTGRPPFTGTALEVALAHLDDEPPDPRDLRPELGEELARVALAALAKDPAGRPRTPAMYANLLRASTHGST